MGAQQQAEVVKEILNTYGRSTGQQINPAKCSIMFNSRERLPEHDHVKNVLEIEKEVFEAKYLGLPTARGRIKGEHFQDLRKTR